MIIDPKSNLNQLGSILMTFTLRVRLYTDWLPYVYWLDHEVLFLCSCDMLSMYNYPKTECAWCIYIGIGTRQSVGMQDLRSSACSLETSMVECSRNYCCGIAFSFSPCVSGFSPMIAPSFYFLFSYSCNCDTFFSCLVHDISFMGIL